VLFEGFLKLYEEGRDDRIKNGKDEAAEDDDSRRLPRWPRATP
jgi:DNA topoisomerase-1